MASACSSRNFFHRSLANLALADLSEGLNRGWGHRDSRSIMILQTERAGVEIKVDPQRLTEAMEKKAKAG